MKAILVVDMPDSCIECQLRTFELTGYYGTCLASDDEHDIHAESEWEQNKRWSGCPLKPMPQKREENDVPTFSSSFERGWNACLEEINATEKVINAKNVALKGEIE